MEWLFLLLGLGIVTLVGHGVWVLLAFVGRTLFGEPSAGGIKRQRCPNCARPMLAADRECRYCGYRPASFKKSELDDLEAVERQLRRWGASGELKPRLVERFAARIQAYRRELLRTREAAPQAEQKIAAPVAQPVHAATVLAQRRKETAAVEETPVEAILVEAAPAKPFAGLAAAASGQAAAQPIAKPVAPPAPKPLAPPPPRRSFGEMLAAFMEQRNIRWGELVGGLLIVCSSIALVISLWDTLKTIPYSQFFILVGVSAALFGVGLYTEHRWKLESTSRGILIIATLLVPLNFVAMAGTARPGWDALAIVLEVASLAVFIFLVERAGRVLSPEWRWQLTFAVVGNSGLLLLARHQPEAAWVAVLAALAAAVHAIAVGGAIYSLRRIGAPPVSAGEAPHVDAPSELPSSAGFFGAQRAGELFVLLGASSFALVAALGLFVARSADRTLALNWLSPFFALGAVPACAAGLVVVRNLKADASLAAWRMAGTVVALIGALGMLIANALAWPTPAALVAVGVLNFAALTLIALRYRLPAAHAAAIASLVAVYVIGAHLALGHFAGVGRELLGRQIIELFFDRQTGLLLVGLFAAFAAASELLARRGKSGDARYYAGGCIVAAAASLWIIAAHAYWVEDAGKWDVLFASSIYGAAALAFNLRCRRAGLSYLGSALLVVGLLDAAYLRPAVELDCPWMAAWLAHASISLALAFAFGRYARRAAGEVEHAFVKPLVIAASVGSLVSLASLVDIANHPPLALSGCFGWLAAIWLLLAVRHRSAGWFAAFQTALTASLLAFTTDWLYQQAWVNHQGRALVDPRSLQVYGIALGLFAAGWSAARIALRRLPAAATLVEDSRTAVDRWAFYLTALGGLALACWGILPETIWELSPQGTFAGAPSGATSFVFGPYAWPLVAAQALALLVALWDRWRADEIACAVFLCVTAAVLAAGPFAASQAAASALRWTLGGAFLLVSMLVWLRAPLARLAERLSCRCEAQDYGPVVAQSLLLTLCAAPVLAVTGLVVNMQLVGVHTAGPLAGSWFAQIGFSVSYLVPMAIVALTLLGYALREVSPGYAFSAGLVTNLAAGGGYALSVRQFGAVEAVTLAQLSTIIAALWAVGWLAIRGKLLAFSGRQESAAAKPLLRVQLGLGTLGNLLLILPALAALAVVSPGAFGEVRSWVATVGSPLGWAALVAAVGAGGFAGWQWRGRLRPEVVGLVGMAALGLGACTVAWAGAADVWPYRALMLGWALFSLCLVAATWQATIVYAGEHNASLVESLTRSAALWVRLAGLLALALGLKTALFVTTEQPWAAAAIALASAACATMAVWRRHEGWAFVAGLGVNVAATIVVWHWQFADRFVFADDFLMLVQANLIAAAAVALLWLAAHERMYADRLLSIGAGPLLGVQIALIVIGNIAALGIPLAELFYEPDRIGRSLVQAGGRSGWLAWLLGGAAVVAYCQKVARRELPHVLTALLLGVGVLAAGAAAAWRGEPWLPYHVLLTAWAGGGFVLLAIAWGIAPRLAWLGSLTRAESLLASISTIEFLVAALAMRGAWDDPGRPYWTAGATLAAGLLAAFAAIGLGKPDHKYASGVLVNLAVVWAAVAARRGLKVDYWLIQLIVLGAQAIVWSLLARWFERRGAGQRRGDLPAFEHAAVAVGSLLVCLTVFYNVLRAAGWVPYEFAAGFPLDLATFLDVTALRRVTPLAWAAWGASALAIVATLGDAQARYRWPGLYAIGLAGAALAVERTATSPLQLAQYLAPVLAGYLLIAALVAGYADKILSYFGKAKEAIGEATSRADWFSPTQFALMSIACCLSLWVALYPALPADRLPGAIAAAIALAAAFVAANKAAAAWGDVWRLATWSLAAIALAEFGWVWLTGEGRIFWLHRQIVLASSLFAAALAGQFALRKFWPLASAWVESARRASIVFGGLLLALLTVVLAQEWELHVPEVGVAMSPLAFAAMVVMLAGSTGLALLYAVSSERDPLRLSLRGRTAYVYAAELLALLVFIHVRTTMPKLLPIGVMEKYWTLIVMLVAFAGAGLAEFFQRRRLDVLSQPLVRTALVAPLVPLVGHWLIPAIYINAETVLLMVAAFYGLQAALRRSFALGALSVAAGNAALWLLWHRLRLDFLHHPQLWLIPVALVVLVAEYFNRERLGSQQSGAVRYFALTAIYVSSTADVFISHVGRNLSMPLVLVLMGLSVAGVLAGILLRVRSFLYLGVTFLLVDLSTVIYHAAWDRGHMWVFWLSGIAAGAAIIALFAMFEKRRNELRLAMDRFKQWT